jgi:hypothetical protein
MHDFPHILCLWLTDIICFLPEDRFLRALSEKDAQILQFRSEMDSIGQQLSRLSHHEGAAA